MSTSPKIEIRQSQIFVMTPQLQEAIKLLQMSYSDLSAYIDQEIEQNPLLDIMEESNEDVLYQDMSGGDSIDINNEEKEEAQDYNSGDDEKDSQDYHEITGKDETRHTKNDNYDNGAMDALSTMPTLHEHIEKQIRIDFIDKLEKDVALDLINSLDDAGYLRLDRNKFLRKWPISEERLSLIIEKVQQFDPPGLFAQDLVECLTLQLKDLCQYDHYMERIVNNLELVGTHNIKKLATLCGLSENEIVRRIGIIKSLNPKPAEKYNNEPIGYVVPDVFVYRGKDGQWYVELNSDILPKVIANERYYSSIQEKARDKETKDFVSKHWRNATWLIKALDQRANSILKVAREIVKRQEKFFIHGAQYLRPLALKNIAEATQLHESTVSRVTQNKYIATPVGVFSFKFFFSTALSSVGGIEDVSSNSVRARIKELVDRENKSKPLSDQKIVSLLKYDGITIARRTIAKYRDALNIPASNERSKKVS